MHVKGTVVLSATRIPYLEGQGDLLSRLIPPKSYIITPVIPIINLREQVAVGPGFLKHHILYVLCIG